MEGALHCNKGKYCPCLDRYARVKLKRSAFGKTRGFESMGLCPYVLLNVYQYLFLIILTASSQGLFPQVYTNFLLLQNIFQLNREDSAEKSDQKSKRALNIRPIHQYCSLQGLNFLAIFPLRQLF